MPGLPIWPAVINFNYYSSYINYALVFPYKVFAWIQSDKHVLLAKYLRNIVILCPQIWTAYVGWTSWACWRRICSLKITDKCQSVTCSRGLAIIFHKCSSEKPIYWKESPFFITIAQNVSSFLIRLSDSAVPDHPKINVISWWSQNSRQKQLSLPICTLNRIHYLRLF